MRNAEASALGELAPVAEGLSLGIEFPLVVDLDGTLIATDALHESLLFFLKRQGMTSWTVRRRRGDAWNRDVSHQ